MHYCHRGLYKHCTCCRFVLRIHVWSIWIELQSNWLHERSGPFVFLSWPLVHINFWNGKPFSTKFAQFRCRKDADKFVLAVIFCSDKKMPNIYLSGWHSWSAILLTMWIWLWVIQSEFCTIQAVDWLTGSLDPSGKPGRNSYERKVNGYCWNATRTLM